MGSANREMHALPQYPTRNCGQTAAELHFRSDERLSDSTETEDGLLHWIPAQGCRHCPF